MGRPSGEEPDLDALGPEIQGSILSALLQAGDGGSRGPEWTRFGDLSNKNQHQLGSYLEIQPEFADWSGLGNPIWDLTSNQQEIRYF